MSHVSAVYCNNLSVTKTVKDKVTSW